MGIERTDTRPPGMRPGSYRFTVDSPILKKKWPSNAVYYEVNCTAVVGGTLQKHRENLAVWKAGPFLKAWGCKQVEKDVFEWDKEAVVGTEFDAEIVEEKNDKDGKTYRRMVNPKKAEGPPPAGPHLEPVDEEVPF